MKRRVPDWLAPLTVQERALWEAFALGETVDLRVGDPDADDVGIADSWGAEREVRAAVITALLLGACPPEPGTLAAVRLCGARVVGDLALADGEVRFPLMLTGCRIGSITADNGSFRSIVLRGSRIDAFVLGDGRIEGVLDLRECRFVDATSAEHRVFLGGSEIAGSVLLSRAEVDGSVRCTTAVVKGTLRLNKATIRNGTGLTLDARLLSTGNQLFAEELHSVGMIDLSDARLGGRLVLDGALLENPDGVSLLGRQMTIAGEVAMRRTTRPFVSHGRVSMPGARVEGTVSMQEAVLTGTIGAFHAGGISVKRSLRLRNADVHGTVLLVDAVIGNQLELSGSRLTSPEDYTFGGAGITVGGETRFEYSDLSDGTTRPFTSDGTVHLDGAKLNANLRMHGARLAARDGEPVLNLSGSTVAQGVMFKDGFTTRGELRLVGTRIGGHLNLSGMTSPDALLNLYAAVISEIYDEACDVWPQRVQLDGLVYETLAPYLPAADRLRLLDRQVGGYRPRPFEKMAAYYRNLGHDDEARSVLLARQRARRSQQPWWRRVPGYLADALTGYGYRPSRAVSWAAGLLLFGSLFFTRYRPEPVHPEDHPAYNPVLYTADRLIPLVHFGPSETWQASGIPLVVGSALTIAGWALGIAIAAGATRSLSRS